MDNIETITITAWRQRHGGENISLVLHNLDDISAIYEVIHSTEAIAVPYPTYHESFGGDPHWNILIRYFDSEYDELFNIANLSFRRFLGTKGSGGEPGFIFAPDEGLSALLENLFQEHLGIPGSSEGDEILFERFTFTEALWERFSGRGQFELINDRIFRENTALGAGTIETREDAINSAHRLIDEGMPGGLERYSITKIEYDPIRNVWVFSFRDHSLFDQGLTFHIAYSGTYGVVWAAWFEQPQ